MLPIALGLAEIFHFLEQQSDGLFADFVGWLGNRSKSGAKIRCPVEIVEAQDTHPFRAANAAFVDGPHQPQGHLVGARACRRWWAGKVE